MHTKSFLKGLNDADFCCKLLVNKNKSLQMPDRQSGLPSGHRSPLLCKTSASGGDGMQVHSKVEAMVDWL